MNDTRILFVVQQVLPGLEVLHFMHPCPVLTHVRVPEQAMPMFGGIFIFHEQIRRRGHFDCSHSVTFRAHDVHFVLGELSLRCEKLFFK